MRSCSTLATVESSKEPARGAGSGCWTSRACDASGRAAADEHLLRLHLLQETNLSG